MQQPYIYTMPENFLLDQSVPARWRLLAVINSFLLNGKPFYGSNVWLMEQLNCSEQTVSNAVQELEDLHEVVCTRTRRSRVITRKLRDPNQLGSETQVGSVRDPSWFGTISDSISDNNTSEAPLRIVDENEKPPKEKKDTTYRRVFELWGMNYPLQWRANRTEIASAQNILTELDGDLALAEKMLALYKKHKAHQYCPSILSPVDLDRKWDKLKEFAKKHQ